MITAIVSNGEFLWSIIEDTGNTSKFCDFLRILNYALNYAKLKESSELVIMLDNASIHSSNKTLNAMENLSINWQFLPAYSPSLAPVELFFRIVNK